MKHDLKHIIDVERAQRLLEAFCEAVGISAAIIDVRGEVIVCSRWQRICTEFHRAHEVTEARCIASDIHLAGALADGKASHIYQCENGLTDAAAPIYIDGEHVANAFIGQFLLKPPDMEHFRAQAARYGFDANEYLAALAEVPIISELKVPALLSFLGTFAEMAAAIGMERRRLLGAQEALEESEAHLRGVLRAAPAGIGMVIDRIFTQANDRLCDITGYSREELIGKSDRILYLSDEDHAYAGREKYRQILREGKGTLEMRWRRKDASIIDVLLISTPVDANDLNAGVVFTALDITARKHAEQERDRLFDLSIDMLCVAGFDGFLKQVNPAWTRTLGWTEEELLTRRWLDFAHPDDRHATVQAGERLIRGESLYAFENRWKCKAGEYRWLSWNSFPLPNEELIFAVCRDVTERKQAEEERRQLEVQIQHAQKLESLGVLAGGIAHDFNNLLMSVLGNADLALQELPSTSPTRGNLNDIVTASRRAADLCRQMLAYSGKGKFVAEPVDLSRLVEEMGHMLQVSVAKSAVLRYELADDLPAIEADATQVRQVVMNLITNASDAVEERSGIIVVRTGSMRCDKDYLSESYLAEDLPEGVYTFVEVNDSGCGMGAETQAKLFDPFFTTKFTGRGLGLSAVLGIVRGHRGAIKVYSEVGKGTTFKVLFPSIDRAVEAVEEKSDGLSEWTGTGVVLLVDDEETVRGVGMKMLERLGFSVVTAVDGRDALEVYKRHASDIVCVLLDLTMPHMNGEETFRELRRMQRDLPVILSSGYNEQEVTQRFVGRGLAGFIQKPYRVNALKEEFRRILG